ACVLQNPPRHVTALPLIRPSSSRGAGVFPLPGFTHLVVNEGGNDTQSRSSPRWQLRVAISRWYGDSVCSTSRSGQIPLSPKGSRVREICKLSVRISSRSLRGG